MKKIKNLFNGFHLLSILFLGRMEDKFYSISLVRSAGVDEEQSRTGTNVIVFLTSIKIEVRTAGP